MNRPVKTILRSLFQAVCLFLVAVGLLAATLAGSFVSVMVVVWFKEGALQILDWKMLGAATKWLVGSCLLVGVAWWLQRKSGGNLTRDGSFRLVEVRSGQSEKIVQNVADLVILVLLVIWLWSRIPGAAISRISMVVGWLTIGFIGMHARIALHEIGHLAAARFVGFELRKIQVGVGPLLWSRSFANGLRSEWRAWPQGGHTFATQRNTDGYRARQSFVVAAGPLTDAVILWLSCQLAAPAFGGLEEIQGAWGVVSFALFWWTVISAVGGLVPHQRWMDHQKVWTDGYWLLRLWTGSRAQVAELARNSDGRGLLDLLKSDSARSVMHPDAGAREFPAFLGGPAAFHEQRTLLSSRLLRKTSIISSPQA
jgi:hypothetical protein